MMEDLGVERVHGTPIGLSRLSAWRWDWSWNPRVEPFVLLVAARGSAEDEIAIRKFADDAVQAGCGCLVAWGDGCELVHDVFDQARDEAGRFVMTSWHDKETLAEALYFALVVATINEDAFPQVTASGVVLAVEEPWVEEVRSLVADQEKLARLWTADED